MNQRGAIGLSVNFLVIIIISLVILAGGISLLYKLISGAEDIKSTLDSKTQAQLDRLLLDEGQKVALPSHTAYLHPGEDHIFGLGVLNINDEEYGTEFTVDITPSKAYDNEENEIAPPDSAEWLLYTSDFPEIKENQHQTKPIMVIVPKTARKGTYIFNVKVKDRSNQPYDTTKKFTVIIR